MSANACQLNQSKQYFIEGYLQGLEILKFLLDADTIAAPLCPDPLAHRTGQFCLVPNARPISCSDCPAFQRHQSSLLCIAESPNRLPSAINATFRRRRTSDSVAPTNWDHGVIRALTSRRSLLNCFLIHIISLGTKRRAPPIRRHKLPSQPRRTNSRNLLASSRKAGSTKQ